VLVVVSLIGLGALANQKPKAATAAPSLTPSGGSYSSVQPVVIDDTTPGAVIHYTVDGTTPSKSSPAYTQPLTYLRNGTVVRAMAIAPGYGPSSDVTGAYQWNGPSTYDQGKASYDRKEYAEARPLFAQACDGGEVGACTYLGYLYANGWGGAKDVSKARTLFQRACDQGNLRSCANLGSLYQNAGNTDEARTYFQKACNGGVTEGCEMLHGIK
jgi:tetratricopeptide (TPR) repeat protein